MGRFGGLVIAALLVGGIAGGFALQGAEPGGAAATADPRVTTTIGGGSGTITSDPAGIDCPPACLHSFRPDGTVLLTATPASGFVFERWESEPRGACGLTPGTPNECMVRLGSSDVLVRAFFLQTAAVRVVPNGSGAVIVSPAGVDLDDPSRRLVTTCDSAVHAFGCRLAYPPGTRVTATAAPATGRTFGGWSNRECGSVTCSVELPAGESSLVATFNPLQLLVLTTGSGTVTSTPAGIDCSRTRTQCTLAAPLGTRVVLTASAGREWRFGCEPEGGDPRAARCTATVTAAPTEVGVAFGGAGGPRRSDRVSIRLDVFKRAAGAAVRGRRIDCRQEKCSATYKFGDMEELRPVDARNAVFRRWINGCGTTRVCRFPVGPITEVEAVFGTPLAARYVRVAVRAQGGRRQVVTRIRVNQNARVTLRLNRGGRRIASRAVSVRQGQTTVRLQVPRRAAAGRYTLVALVKAGSEQRRLVRTVRVPRR